MTRETESSAPPMVAPCRDLTAAAPLGWIRKGIADFKLPDRIEYVSDLPRTAVGKIDKQGLRRRLAPTEHKEVS